MPLPAAKHVFMVVQALVLPLVPAVAAQLDMPPYTQRTRDTDMPFGPDADCRLRRLAAEYAADTQRGEGAAWASQPDMVRCSCNPGNVLPCSNNYVFQCIFLLGLSMLYI